MRVRIVQLDKIPRIEPQPLENGFSIKGIYEVYGWALEAGELEAILVNDRNQIWAVSNRHLRFVPDRPGHLSEEAWAKVQFEKEAPVRPPNIDPELWKTMHDDGS